MIQPFLRSHNFRFKPSIQAVLRPFLAARYTNLAQETPAASKRAEATLKFTWQEF